MRSVCVYCGSKVGADPAYVEAARALGAGLARRSLRTVFGGGGIGMMGQVADAALAAGGEVVGVIPQKLMQAEVAHGGLSALHVTEGMHDRKAMMADLSDAFVTLPGGLGTLEELFETWTWAQLRYHEKPLGLLNVNGYFDGLLAFLEHAVAEGYVVRAHRDLLVVAESVDDLLDRLC